TTDPGRNWVLGWSPDGRDISVVHDTDTTKTFLLISTVTGAVHKLVDFSADGASLTPDGRAVIVAVSKGAPNGAGLYMVPIEGGPPRLVMPKPATANGFVAPSLSPDGHHVAYIECAIGCDLKVVEIDGRRLPISTAHELARHVWPGWLG